mmetsp:Transcript_12232/g.21814  ORF Transcript_12232/g.21814 Transcript_12232/m.21814 type:complete len:115 (+) Transcript_12232:330-674(+)|eukprot:CAMPEP_0184510456 /NCGR_PEP_ID=MMETSP0198_2-20121128/1825_1 /TAXON_ID=1112570 /ORGANISM="Thraustochytrium sp., Strain LLF1b" /LENGTH=114 /DNA_ID=CAMNT_0026900351 /DNA_START=408 /DNA_END=752 /DNA_ORIENTATION=+
MSGEHVKLNEDEVEGHEPKDMRKHLTMKYNMKDLRKFTDFEMWIMESLEDLIPDDKKRPVIECTKFKSLSTSKISSKLHKQLASGIKDKETRAEFIDEFLLRFNKLPKAILDSL